MAQTEKDNRIVLEETGARKKLLEGAEAVYKTVSTTYGPKGRNVLLEKPFGRPVLTRDGVTVARDTYFKDRAKNMGAQLLIEASEVTNRIAGDGTSATVVLGYNLFKQGVQNIAAGIHPMEVKDLLIKDSRTLLAKLDELKKPTKKGQLEQVATVSAGDPLLGKLIAEAVEYVGADGGILTEKSYVQEVEREYVDGYYLQSGFEALQMGKKELIDPMVIVSARRLSSAQDAANIINQASITNGVKQGTIPRFLLIGNIEEAAYMAIVQAINQGAIDAVILKTPPMFGAMSNALLEDITIYAGCEPITDGTNLQEVGAKHIGTIDKVVAGKSESTLFAVADEAINKRVDELRGQIEDEVSDAVIEKLRDRIAKLEGKVALFRIGGATDTEKEELEFRVEDGIQATRAAYSDGVVAGGGITLLELSKEDISPLYRNALQDTFKQLLINANVPSELGLDHALQAPSGYGFNLRKDNTIVDMVKEGILDPALVTEQTIANATSAVSGALTIGNTLIFEDKTE